MKVDRDVKDELGESKVKKAIATTKEELAAKKQKIKSVSHSGGTKSQEKPTKTPINKANVGGIEFKGFEDEDLEETEE